MTQTPKRGLFSKALFGIAGAALALAASGCNQSGDPENTDWLMRGGDFRMQQHANLHQISLDNIDELGLAWAVEIPNVTGLVGNPLVKDGIVYQSGTGSRIYANDIRTGKLMWEFDPELDIGSMGPIASWSARLNRGLGLTDNAVVVASGDCRVFAVDQMTGEQLWETQSCEGPWMGITGAPQTGDGKVFVGNNCGDTGFARGHVDAFDDKTGKLAWRFWTVPGDPSKPQDSELMEMAAKTWGTDWYSKSRGCGSAWDSMTYDAETNLVYVGIGGPGPWVRNQRAADAGDELFTNAVVALNASTGEYVWHYTVTPQDGWNFEAVGPIMIANLQIDGEQRRVLMLAPKNGFFFVLDAATGKFISAKNPIPVNWASGYDENGRPIYMDDAKYWEKPEGAIIWPEPVGTHSWSGIAFDPESKLAYVPYDITPTRAWVENGTFRDDMINLNPAPGQKIPKRGSELIAWDPVKQEARWKVTSDTLVNGGILHTAGGLVFQGTSDGHFKAFDAATGEEVWDYYVQGGVRSAPTSVMVDGEQYILIATGNSNSMVAGRYIVRGAVTPVTEAAPSMLLAFKIGGKATLPKVEPKLLAKPDFPKPNPQLAAMGKALYEGYNCLICHGRYAHSPGGEIPSLRDMDGAKYEVFGQIVKDGLLAQNGMPGFANLDKQSLDAMKAYIQSMAWEGYEAQQQSEN